MGTKTLAVKFEVTGVKEGQLSLNNFKQSINQSLQENKSAVASQFSEQVGLIKSEEKREKLIEKTNQKIFFSYLGLKAKVKKESSELFANSIKNIKSSSRALQKEIKDALIPTFGSKTEKQNLIIRQEKADFSQRATYKNLSVNNRSLVLEFRLAYREFFTELQNLLENSKLSGKDDGFDKIGAALSAPFKIASDAISFPFQATLFGAFQRIGEVQTEDFAIGFTKKMQKSLGLQFEEVGNDVGDIFGEGIYRIYESILKRTKEGILSDLEDKTPQVKDFIEDIKNVFVGSFIKALAVPVKAHKRIQLTKKAIPATLEQAGELLLNKEISPEEKEQINNKDSISMLVAGVNMDSESKNTEFVERLLKEYLEDTFIVAIKNFWSNSKIGPEYKAIVNKIIKNILTNPSTSGSVQSFLKDRGLVDAMRKMDGVEEIDQDKIAETIIEFLETKDIPLIKLLETAFEGYNPDDVMIAAQAMFYKNEFPDKPINIIGTSAGGFNAAAILEILNKLGYKDIRAAGITTPLTGLEFTGNSEDYLASIGTEDFLYKAIFEGIFKDFLIPPEMLQVIEGAGQAHLLPLFMSDPKFKARFAEFFKGRLKIKKGTGSGEMGYITRRVQNPEDENLQRTVLKASGEKTDEGYVFNSQDLKGFTREIKKKAKRIKDSDLKQDAENFIEFLDSLIEELEIIEVVGGQLKPSKSVEKAKNIYPALKNIKVDENSRIDENAKKSIQNQVKENKKFIGFKQKINQESDNIKRTLKVLQGQSVEGYSFEADHLAGLINYLENNLLSGASSKEKAKAFKYLDYLKRLQQKIVDYNQTSQEINQEFVQEGKNLFFPESQTITNQKTNKVEKQKKDTRSIQQQIIDRYNQQLNQIIKQANRSAIKALAENEIRINPNNAYSAIQDRIKEYRQAVSNGLFQQARDTGELLLRATEYLKLIFNQTGDPRKGQLTRIQNEILKGDRGAGRSSIPLAEIFRQTDSVQLELPLGEVTEGIQENINRESGEEIGRQFAEGIVEGAEDELDIRSPSKVFEWIGKQVKAGFEKGIKGISNLINQELSIQDNADEIAKLFDFNSSNFLESARQFIVDFIKNPDIEKAIGTFSNLGGKVLKLWAAFEVGKILLKTLGLDKFINAFFNLPDVAIEAANAVELLDKRIVDISGSAIKGAENLEFITSKAKEFGKNITEAKDNYAQLLGATRDTGLAGETTETIYTAFAALAKNKGLSNAEETRLFRSIRSIIGKQVLSQEEVRQEIGELLGDFPRALAVSQGLSIPQLNKQIELGQLTASDALPKVAQYYLSQNALGNSSGTGAAAAVALNNSIVDFQQKIGQILQPIQKFGNNFLAGFFSWLTNLITQIQTLVVGFFGVLLVNLVRVKLFLEIIKTVLLGLFKILWALKGAIAVFASEMILLTAAFQIFINIWGMISDRLFPKIDKDIKKLTLGIEEYSKAIKEANSTQLKASPLEKPHLAEGIELPGEMTTFTGSRYLNLDSLIREPINAVLNSVLKITPWAGLILPSKLKTAQELKQENTIIDNSKVVGIANKILTDSNPAITAAENINKFDQKIRDIQSKRLELLPSEGEALKESLKAEQEINELRDGQLKILSQYKQNIEGALELVKKQLEITQERYLKGEIDPPIYERDTAMLQNTESALEEGLKKVDEIISQVSNSLSEFERKVRNAGERIKGFTEKRARITQQQRAEVIETGVTEGKGEKVIQLKIEAINQAELKDNIAQIQQELKQSYSRLNSGALAEGNKLIQASLKENNLPLNSVTIDRMLQEQERTLPEKSALKELQLILDLEGQLSGFQEQLAQNLQQNRNTVIDFVRTINDYFFRLEQQLKEATVEIKRLTEQIFSTNIKTKLRAAIVPGSESFLNGIIEQIQGFLDQASQYAEKILGVESGKIQFESQQYDYKTQLQDFARQVAGASEAIALFTKSITSSVIQSNVTNGHPQAPPFKGGERVTGYLASDNQQVSSTATDIISAQYSELNNKYGVSETPNNLIQQAQDLNNRLMQQQQEKLRLQKELNQAELEQLNQTRDQTIEGITRQFEIQKIESDRLLNQIKDRVTNFGFEFSLDNATAQLEKQLINVKTQFRDFEVELDANIRKFDDFVVGAEKFIQTAPDAIASLRSQGRDLEADFTAEALAQIQTALPDYLKIQADLNSTKNNLPTTQSDALKFLEEQGRINIELEASQRRSTKLQLQTAIAARRGTLEQERQFAIEQERERLKGRLLELQKTLTGEELALTTKLEKQNSAATEENLTKQYQDKELGYEQQLIELQAGQKTKQAGFLSYLGFDLEANKLQKEAANIREKLRFKQEKLRIEFDFAGEPEKLKLLREEAESLHQINLKEIENQFKDLGATLQDLTLKGFQNFFTDLFNAIASGGQNKQQLLQQELDYTKQLLDLENQYRDNPVKLAQMKNRVKELNEQKLDQLKNEFGLFNQVLNIGKSVLSGILKEIAGIAARRIAGGLFKAIFNAQLGATVTADNYAQGGTPGKARIVPASVSNVLRTISKPIKSAFSREGSKGVLGVFTPGEEILSLKTGEAQRYQGLKSALGNNPLKTVFAGNFADGGTVESNILNSFDRPSFRFDSSNIKGTTTSNNNSRTINLSANFVTPNADSFRASEYQIQQDLAEKIARASKR